ncbi:DUF2569 family protein [Sphingomonas sp. VDB2]|uniref:DUF2569 family protein n=1 Tax=Sphingomonas sp. VDB2 TaxID=3228751 RepID=UPI003A80A6DC
MVRAREISNDPSGIGGWLLVLVAMLIFTPIYATIHTILSNAAFEAKYPDFGPTWQNVKTVVWGGIILSGSLYIASAFLLIFRREISTVRLVVCAIWLAGPVNQFVGPYIIAGFTTGTLDVSTIIIPIMFSLVVATILTLYLCRSRRVANTYFGTAEPK